MEDNKTETKPEEETSAKSQAAEGVNSAGDETSSDEATQTNGDRVDEDLLKKLEAATAEAAEHKERYIRAVAELENYRKRAVRDREEARRQAGASFVDDILPVLENFGLGLQSAENHDAGKAFLDGFKMVHSQLKNALMSNGVEEINPEGEAFDPNWHESIAHIPNETVEEGNIVEVHRVGYRYQQRLVRPAMVVVSSGKPAEAGTDKSEESDSKES